MCVLGVMWALVENGNSRVCAPVLSFGFVLCNPWKLASDLLSRAVQEPGLLQPKMQTQLKMNRNSMVQCQPARSRVIAPSTSAASSAAAAGLYSAEGIKPPNKGKHFLHLDDFSKEELQNMLDLGLKAKKKFYARDESFKPFQGQTMAMIFTKPSARTRVSFETVSSSTA